MSRELSELRKLLRNEVLKLPIHVVIGIEWECASCTPLPSLNPGWPEGYVPLVDVLFQRCPHDAEDDVPISREAVLKILDYCWVLWVDAKAETRT